MRSAHAFSIRAADLPDVLIRLLGPFAVRQARLAAVDHVLVGGAAEVSLVVEGLSDADAAHLRERLLAMPCVRAAEVGPPASRKRHEMNLHKEKISF